MPTGQPDLNNPSVTNSFQVILNYVKLTIKTITESNNRQQQNPKILITPNAGEDVEQWKLSFIADRDTQWCSNFGRQFDNPS